MVIIVCKESGIEFEAASKRTQQHPLIAQLKERANKNGTYRETNEALAAVRKTGGYATIEEFEALVEAHINAKKEAQNQRTMAAAQARDKENAEREERAAIRRIQNAMLKANDYEWHKYSIFDETQEVIGEEWKLRSPDGRFVTVEQALGEIERGVAVVLAEIEAKRQADEATATAAAEIEAKRQADEAASDNAAYAAFDAAVAAVKAVSVQVNRFEFGGFSKIIKMGKVSTSYRCYDCIWQGAINGVVCYVIFTDSGYDYDGSAAYYSEDAVTAGLELYENTSDNVGRWF